MKINNSNINIEDLVVEDLHKNLHKTYGKDIYLSENEIKVLEKYDFNINNYSDIKRLIFNISEYLDDNSDLELDDLESVCNSLQEFNYYHNTNK